MEEPKEFFKEHDYLVSRGVRPLAIVGQCPSDPIVMLKMATQIEASASRNVIPFMIERKDGFAEYGYAASAWVLDLYRWLTTSNADIISPKQRDRILGLLCGYSVEAIRTFEERNDGRFFSPPIELP